MSKTYQGILTKKTSQGEQARVDQAQNRAGGYAWEIDDWKRLQRFLILGTEGGTYYANERSLTIENAQAVARCIQEDGERTVREIVAVSVAGKAHKNDQAIFALAIAATQGNATTKAVALHAVPDVCRTGTHLFQFAGHIDAMRGWGRGVRKAIARWYARPVQDVAYHAIKYRQRDGWTHRDVLRLAHAKPASPAHDDLFAWIVKGAFKGETADLAQVRAFERIQAEGTTIPDALALVKEHRLPWEALPTEMLARPEVWAALLDGSLPLMAMVRNLGRMTSNGALKPLSAGLGTVVARLSNADQIHKSRMHPIHFLAALITYAQGHGTRGSLSWVPIAQVTDALDRAFYASFENVEPTGKRTLLALDVSGSMNMGFVSGVEGLTPRAASAALALVTASREPNHHIIAFSHGVPGEWVPTGLAAGNRGQHRGYETCIVAVGISPRMRLDSAIQEVNRIPLGGTDCALPMLYALEQKIDVDAFVIYTDNETWAGKVHPFQALQEYRRKTGINAKLAVVAMTADKCSIADPKDAGMMDFCGFSTDTPQAIADFFRE